MNITLKEKGIYTIKNFLSEEECQKYLSLVFTPPREATNFTDSGLFKNMKWVDQELADLFYKKLANYIDPTELAIRANKLIMTGNYESGQQFSLHTDTGLFYDKKNREKSRWTLLIYLNDNFEGGNTLFYDDNWNLTEEIKPEKGKALLFDIDLWHRGDILKSGIKQWIGCEIIGKFMSGSNK
jgi:prolyl 4-hydroxylase